MSSPASKALLLLAMAFVIISPSYVVAQSPASSPAPDCSTLLLNLYPCLDFAGGNDTAPSKNCCVAFGDFVKTSVVCLCDLVTGGAAATYGINQTKALQLPSLCSVKTPPVSLCPGSPAPQSTATHSASAPGSVPSSGSRAPQSTATPSASAPGSVPPSGALALAPKSTATPSASAPGSVPPSGSPVAPSPGSTSPPSTKSPTTPSGTEEPFAVNFLFVMVLAVLSVRMFVI